MTTECPSCSQSGGERSNPQAEARNDESVSRNASELDSASLRYGVRATSPGYWLKSVTGGVATFECIRRMYWKRLGNTSASGSTSQRPTARNDRWAGDVGQRAARSLRGRLRIMARYQSARIDEWISHRLEDWLGLTIIREKTSVVRLERGENLDFLGFTFRYDRDLYGGAHSYLNRRSQRKYHRPKGMNTYQYLQKLGLLHL